MRALGNNRLLWLAVGVVVGSLSSGFLPHAPLHAAATHGEQGFAIATGYIDTGVEGVYVLDSLTGDLKCAVLINGKFSLFYEHNVLRDFPAGGSKTPRFLMVTGETDMRRTPGSVRMGRSAVYVAEATTGVVVAYGVPYGQGVPAQAGFVRLDMQKFRTVAIRQP